MEKIAFVLGDDWSAVYVDRKLRHEGHSIPRFVWLQLLDEAGIETADLEADYDWLEEHGRFPENLEDVKFL